MKEFTVPMALLDFVPVCLFFIACLRVGLDLKHKMSAISKLLYFAGFIAVSAAGGLKALYKLLYASGVGDISWMNEQFFSVQSFGFLIAGVGLLMSLGSGKKSGDKTLAVIPTAGLVGIIIVGETAMYAALCKFASKCGKKNAIVLFVLSYFMSLCMGYLSSRDFDSASLNWLAQGINTVGQICLLTGAMIIHKAGLGKEEN